MAQFQNQVRTHLRVSVYNVRLYDVIKDEFLISRRMATQAGAATMGGVIMPETEVLIDPDQLENGEQWTERDFKPSAI
jgi:hypothetical protein